jgi:hypothetical protein
MISFRKWMILIHRWLGIALSLLFVVWFVSGIAMIYARGMPSLTSAVRLERMPPLDFSRIRVTPLQAAEVGVVGETPGRAVLMTVMDRPAYRFAGGITVFADTGELAEPAGEAGALKIAERFMSVSPDRLQYIRQLETADQWTIAQRRGMPLHKIAVDDEARTELYVSDELAEVSVLTTRGSRALAWVAAIPHWLYFAPLRLNDSLWRQVVLWTSGLGCVLAIVGIIVGVIQFSASKPHIPYAGWMRWHYITGAVFGLFTLTWVFSGMLSMEPSWMAYGGGSGEGMEDAFSGGQVDLTLFPPVDAGMWNQALAGRSVKEIQFERIQGDAYYVARGSGRPLLLDADPLQVREAPFELASLMTRAREGNPDFPIVESEMLSEFDSYYYARDPQPPLPVLRVKYGDPDETWFYIDPAMSRVMARYTSRDRIVRWLYNGFHSLDFSFWYYNRPLWDIGVIVLSIGGTLSSGIGLFIGAKRLVRKARKASRSGRPVQTQTPVAKS